MSTSPSNLKLTEEIFTAPAEAFRSMRVRYPWVFPFFLVFGLSLAAWVYYFLAVDIEWLARHQVEMLNRDLTDEQKETILASLTREYQLISAIVTVIVLVPVTYLLQSFYFQILSVVQGDNRGFREWFSFVSWTSLPNALALLAMIVYNSVSDPRLAIEDLNILSIDRLILNLEDRSPYKGLFSSVSIMTFWSIALMVLGYRQWLSVSTLRSVLIVVAPYILFYGAWFMLAG